MVGGYANERPWIDGHRGIKGGGEHKSRGDDMTSWGVNDYANGVWGWGCANEKPCIYGHGGIKGGGEHNSRAG